MRSCEWLPTDIFHGDADSQADDGVNDEMDGKADGEVNDGMDDDADASVDDEVNNLPISQGLAA